MTQTPGRQQQHSARVAACLLTAALLTGCAGSMPPATPASFTGPAPTPAASPASPAATPVTSDGVSILSPADGASLPASPLEVRFTVGGGPFIEADLVADNAVVASATEDGTSVAINGSLVWEHPTGGRHNLTLQALDMNKGVHSASITVTIEGAAVTPVPSQTPDAGSEVARTKILAILHDTYGLTMTSPPISRKAREGVTTDPWVASVFLKHWFIDVSVYPDGRVMDYADPLAYADPAFKPSLIQPDDKPISRCRPSGTLKILAAVVDYHNMGATGHEALAALADAAARINAKYLEASRAVGLTSPILQVQVTTVYLPSPPKAPGGLLTAAAIGSATGVDPTGFDILAQIDLDSADTAGIIKVTGSHGWDSGGCWPVKGEVNMWMAISDRSQLNADSADPRLINVLGHELLHAFGYPIGLSGVHEWACGDGTVPDATDQCDQNNLPTLMLGWTDTDGDGVVEILDPTPYGMTTQVP
jgi:hypothetical protein